MRYSGRKTLQCNLILAIIFVTCHVRLSLSNPIMQYMKFFISRKAVNNWHECVRSSRLRCFQDRKYRRAVEDKMMAKAKEKEDDSKGGLSKAGMVVKYFDPGSHWCKVCGHVSLKLIDHLDHMQSGSHMKVSLLSRLPWLPRFRCALIWFDVRAVRVPHSSVLGLSKI